MYFSSVDISSLCPVSSSDSSVHQVKVYPATELHHYQPILTNGRPASILVKLCWPIREETWHHSYNKTSHLSSVKISEFIFPPEK